MINLLQDVGEHKNLVIKEAACTEEDTGRNNIEENTEDSQYRINKPLARAVMIFGAIKTNPFVPLLYIAIVVLKGLYKKFRPISLLIKGFRGFSKLCNQYWHSRTGTQVRQYCAKWGKKLPWRRIIACILITLGLSGAGVFLLTDGDISKLDYLLVNKPVVINDSQETDFVKNETAGRLFIIEGRVVNKSLARQDFIQVKVDLISKGDKLSQSLSAYCGNILTVQELRENSLEEINQRLGNKFGDNRTNIGVKPGATIPFMLVIPELPPDLIMYEVKVQASGQTEKGEIEQ